VTGWGEAVKKKIKLVIFTYQVVADMSSFPL